MKNCRENTANSSYGTNTNRSSRLNTLSYTKKAILRAEANNQALVNPAETIRAQRRQSRLRILHFRLRERLWAFKVQRMSAHAIKQLRNNDRPHKQFEHFREVVQGLLLFIMKISREHGIHRQLKHCACTTWPRTDEPVLRPRPTRPVWGPCCHLGHT